MWKTGFYRAALLVAVVLLLASTGAGVASAAPAGTVLPTNLAIQAAQGQAAQLERQIAADSQRQQIAGESFDQANVVLNTARSRLAQIRRAIAVKAKRIAKEKMLVQRTAVDAYVYAESASAQFGAILSNNLANAQSIATYAGAATNRLHGAVVQLGDEQQSLAKSEVIQGQDVAVAQSAVTKASNAQASLQDAANSLNGTLSQVKGQLATLIAQQEAAAAAAAEIQARAAAASAARTAAAEAAAQAASVAQAIASNNPGAATSGAATSATLSASGASAVGQPTLAPAGTNQAGNKALATAESFLGVPYVWGGASRSGVDCSGLTMLAWASAGVSLAHSAWYQYEESERIPLSALEPGDLIFYYFPNDGTTDPVSHVVMYVGSGPYGTQTILQAPETGEDVSYAPMNYLGLVGAGQPIGAGTLSGPPPSTTTTTTIPPTTTTTTTTLPSTTTTVAPPPTT